jgi:hypothetical protein
LIGNNEFDRRIEMCNGVNEGTEIENIVKNLTRTARMLYAFENHYCQIVLVIAEKLCTDYIKDCILSRQCDWDEYNESCSDEVFAHFSGGAKKLTKEEFDIIQLGGRL